VLSLKEALNLGAVTIHEHGEGSVPELTVINQGKKAVLLAVGDVIQGGKQDRVIISDALIPPTPTPVTIQVNCVEAGRWSDGAQGIAFQYGGRGESGLKKVLELKNDQNSTWAKVAELNSNKASRFGRFAAATTSNPVNDASPQSSLEEPQVIGAWGLGSGDGGTGTGLGGGEEPEIRRNRTVYIDFDDLTGLVPPAPSDLMGTADASELAPPTGTYMASLEASPVSENLAPYLEALGPLLDETRTVGFVAALDGTILGAELYGNARLFKGSKKDILRSLSLDALSRPLQITEAPTALSAQKVARFLRSSLAGKEEAVTSTHGSKGRLAAEQGTTFHTYDAHGDLLHTNIYAH